MKPLLALFVTMGVVKPIIRHTPTPPPPASSKPVPSEAVAKYHSESLSTQESLTNRPFNQSNQNTDKEYIVLPQSNPESTDKQDKQRPPSGAGTTKSPIFLCEKARLNSPDSTQKEPKLFYLMCFIL